MKALSLTQPWATCVAIGAKRIETRSWGTVYRGPLAIHAAKTFPRAARELCFGNPFMEPLMAARYEDVDALPLGAIIAVAQLVDVRGTGRHGAPAAWLQEVLIEADDYPREREFGDYSPGRFAWMLADVRQLTTPIACRGALGLWALPGDVEARVTAQLTSQRVEEPHAE